MNIAYFGYDFFSPCWDVIEKMGHSVTRVFSVPVDGKYNSNHEILQKAASNAVAVSFHRPSLSDFQSLKMSGCDLLISAGYPFRLYCQEVGLRGVNIHPSLLPEGKGPWPIPYVILNEQRQAGVTLHKVSSEMDGGDILLQEAFDVRDTDTGTLIALRSQLLAAKLIEVFFRDVEHHWNNASPQTGGTYLSFPSEELQTLDWNLSVKTLARRIRAFANSDCSAVIEGHPWNVRSGGGWEEPHTFAAGTVVRKTSREFVIAVADGFVCLTSQEYDNTVKKL